MEEVCFADLGKLPEGRNLWHFTRRMDETSRLIFDFFYLRPQ
jgi:hypothetical protein